MRELRQQFKNLRRALSPEQQDHAAKALLSFFLTLPFLSKIQHIAAYIAVDGEISPELIINWCFEQKKHIYLPQINASHHALNTLTFAIYKKNDQLISNQYHIPEPHSTCERREPDQLDLILLPLVAFDRKGHRLGMGQGFYDATLQHVQRPFLLGLAHAFQEAPKLVPQSHDIHLHGIVTDQELILCNPLRGK